MEYQTAIRGAFFDIVRVCDSADAIAQHARYLEAIPTCAAGCCCPVLSTPTSIIRKRR